MDTYEMQTMVDYSKKVYTFDDIEYFKPNKEIVQKENRIKLKFVFWGVSIGSSLIITLVVRYIIHAIRLIF